jgi:hypothetical protein
MVIVLLCMYIYIFFPLYIYYSFGAVRRSLTDVVFECIVLKCFFI